VTSVHAEGLVRLERWLAGVPRGLDSYPEVRAKGSLARSVLEGQPVAELVGRLPQPLRVYVDDPPMAGEWVPEAHLAALILSVADLRSMTDGEVCTWARERNRALFRSPAYKILMAVFSPQSMIRFAARRWEYWHHGTSLAVEGVADEGVRLALRFPLGLFDELMLRAYAEAFTAALEMAHARDPVVTVEDRGPGRATYLARW
jgi:hypothetical protein